MTQHSFRAIAILKAKDGQEQSLMDFTLGVLPEIRKVDGLRSVEVSQAISDVGQLVLYYCWASAEHSERYVAGPVYAKIAPQLQALIQSHLLILGRLVVTKIGSCASQSLSGSCSRGTLRTCSKPCCTPAAVRRTFIHEHRYERGESVRRHRSSHEAVRHAQSRGSS